MVLKKTRHRRLVIIADVILPQTPKGVFLESALCSAQRFAMPNKSESKSANAQIDFVVQRGEKIVPVEVKSGKSGKMQSMRVFLNEKQAGYGISTSLENFA